MARMVSADEASRISREHHVRIPKTGSEYCGWCGDSWPCIEADLSHTVVAQAAEIDRLTQAAEYAAAAFGQRDAALAKVEVQRQHIAGLVKVATREINHVNDGACPDSLEGHEVRDPDCPACYILTVVDL